MNDQLVGLAGGVFLGPANDELLRFAVQVSLVKRGGIHRVEDLLKSLDLHLDELIFGFHRHG